MGTARWKPHWWREDTHARGWDRVREALRRDWLQTRHDLHMGGHELNQGVVDTVKQISGKQPVPAIDQPNPPRVIGTVEPSSSVQAAETAADAEASMEYGYGAREEFGGDRFSLVEPQLRREWESSREHHGTRWEHVRELVRRGFEMRDRSSLH